MRSCWALSNLGDLSRSPYGTSTDNVIKEDTLNRKYKANT